MTKKLTYSEQLKHPNWQRVRLQKLGESDFMCDECMDAESTLHVHHKQYFKGRMAWEYAPYELAVLCESCHAKEHEHEEVLKKIIASSYSQFAFLAGKNLHNDNMEEDEIQLGYNTDPHDFMVGATAYLISQLGINDIYDVAKFAVSLSRTDSEERMIFEHNKYFKKVSENYGTR